MSCSQEATSKQFSTLNSCQRSDAFLRQAVQFHWWLLLGDPWEGRGQVGNRTQESRLPKRSFGPLGAKVAAFLQQPALLSHARLPPSGLPHLFSDMSLGPTARVKLGLRALPEFLSFSTVGGERGPEKRDFAILLPPLLQVNNCSRWAAFQQNNPPPQPFTPAPSSASLCLLLLTAQQLLQSTAAARSAPRQAPGVSPASLGDVGRTRGVVELKGGGHRCDAGLCHYDLRTCHRGTAHALPLGLSEGPQWWPVGVEPCGFRTSDQSYPDSSGARTQGGHCAALTLIMAMGCVLCDPWAKHSPAKSQDCAVLLSPY